jgi:nucleoside-diphosphate-sugar epimerase
VSDPTRILVVGAAGYVGRRLMAVLARRAGVAATGADIRVIPGTADHRLDLAFPAQSFAVVHATRPDVVVNLAYLLSESIEADPQRGIETNIAGVNGLFEACVRLGVPRVLYASSGSVYGEQSIYGDREVDETEPLPPPRSLYQLMKQFNERMAEHYNATSKTRFVALRISSPHGRGKPGFNPFDRMVRAVVEGATSLTLPWPAARDVSFNHVDDVAEVLATMATAAPTHPTYNLGGEAVTIAEMTERLATPHGVRVTFTPGKLVPTMGRISSARLATEFAVRRTAMTEWFDREIAEARAASAGVSGA